MKVLTIGQLPVEAGGNYTTGAANVVYELSRKSVEGVAGYTFGTNIPKGKAKLISTYPNQYMGYKWSGVLNIIKDWLIHPVKSVHQWRHYRDVDHENPLRFSFYKVNIESAINRVKPDIIHVNSIGNISATRFALGNKKIPILLTCHGIFYRGEKCDIVGKDRYLGNIGLADAYSGLTQESLFEYQKYLGISKDKVSIVPNGADCDKFYYDQERRLSLRKEMNVGEDVKVLLTVASVQERKGQYAFVKLLSNLEDVKFQYWIIGKGGDMERIREYVKNNRMEDRIKLLGYHSADELYAYYSAADIYAHVSTQEGQALCDIEANATGMRSIINKKILVTVPGLESRDYYLLDTDDIKYKELALWIKRDINCRCSSRSLDWQNILNMYVALYKKVIREYDNN